MAMKGFFSGALAFGVLLAAAAVACTALSLRLRQRAEESDARASDRALYELGKRDAESAKTDVEGPLGRMLRVSRRLRFHGRCAWAPWARSRHFSACGQAACSVRCWA